MSPDAPPSDSVLASDDVRAALKRVLASGPFARSPQLQRLLAFLVEQTLAGAGNRLKEYVIGLEVFSRPPSYDPRIDSLVRVEARRLRAALSAYYAGEGQGDRVRIELLKGSYVPSFRPGHTLPPPAEVAPSPAPFAHTVTPPQAGGAEGWLTRVRIPVWILILAAIAAAVAVTARFARTPPATGRDGVLLTGFVNSTGEGVFDETLKQGLATALEQSPFLDIVSDRRIGEVLALMGRPALERLKQDEARDLCMRAGAKVVVGGSIHRLGARYVIGLTATDCATGEDLVHVQQEAGRREDVLRSLSAGARRLRGRLGESLSTIQRFGTPVEDATTASLEALQAYSLGRKTARERGSPADIPFYERALELDPDFAAAHAALGVSQMNQGQPDSARAHLEKAYHLRGRVSERERYRLSAYYHQAVTGDLDKAGEVYELWKQSYPRDYAPRVNLGLSRLWLGDYDGARGETEEALRLEPSNVLPYTNLAAILIKLERPAEARAVLDRASGQELTSRFLRLNLCYLAFLAGDERFVETQLAEVSDKPGDEAALLSLQADTEAHFGRLRRSRALTARAADSALRAGSREAAATYLLNGALREAEFGFAGEARRIVAQALGLSGGRDVSTLAALALARAGGGAEAATLLETLRGQYGSNTVTRKYWLPILEAAVSLGAKDEDTALARLGDAAPTELGSPPPIGLATLYPVYLRGEALLAKGQARAAAGEFQRILARPGLVLNFPLHALARLQEARGWRLAGDPAAAVRAYDAFLALWKDADKDVPVLRAAESERNALPR